MLLQLTTTLRIGDCAGGHRLENRGKNRDVMVVPRELALTKDIRKREAPVKLSADLSRPFSVEEGEKRGI